MDYDNLTIRVFQLLGAAGVDKVNDNAEYSGILNQVQYHLLKEFVEDIIQGIMLSGNMVSIKRFSTLIDSSKVLTALLHSNFNQLNLARFCAREAHQSNSLHSSILKWLLSLGLPQYAPQVIFNYISVCNSYSFLIMRGCFITNIIRESNSQDLLT
jgi:hypothetical protein